MGYWKLRRLLIWTTLLFPASLCAQAIRGRLIDAETHQPVARGRLELLAESGRPVISNESSSSGAFTLIAPMPGRYRARALAIGYSPASIPDINIAESDISVGDVLMSRASAHLPDLVATMRPTLAWSSHFYRLWDPQNGHSIAVVAYSLYYHNLTTEGAGDLTRAPVNLELHQGNARGSRAGDTTIYLSLPVPPNSVGGLTYSGYFVVPSADDYTDWTLIVTQPSQPAGGDWEYARPALVAGPLSLSDLVLGAAKQQVTWNNRGDRVVLAAREPIAARDSVHLYYQVRSAVNRGDVHSDIAVYHVDKGIKLPTPVLRVAFDGALQSGLNAAQHVLDSSKFEPGRYRFEVSVLDRSTGQSARQAVTMYIE